MERRTCLVHVSLSHALLLGSKIDGWLDRLSSVLLLAGPMPSPFPYPPSPLCPSPSLTPSPMPFPSPLRYKTHRELPNRTTGHGSTGIVTSISDGCARRPFELASRSACDFPFVLELPRFPFQSRRSSSFHLVVSILTPVQLFIMISALISMELIVTARLTGGQA